MDEESADSRRLGFRIEQVVFFGCQFIAAMQGFSFAPPAAARKLTIGFDNKVASVSDHLRLLS